MIQNKHYPGWRIDGNREWVDGVGEDEELLSRKEGDETLEDQYLRTEPEDWDVIDHENDDTGGNV